jgi:hypothetical protein
VGFGVYISALPLRWASDAFVAGARIDMPFWTVCKNRARAWISIDPARLHFLSVLLGMLVDLYLVTADAGERARLRQEIEAHMILALDRALSPPPAASQPAAWS